LPTAALQRWNRSIWKPLLIPGGIFLFAVALLTYSGWLTLAPPALSFLNCCVLAGGALLAWRFHSTRIFLALAVVGLAELATSLPAIEHAPVDSPGRIVLSAIAVLLPINLVIIAPIQERGFTVAAIAPVGLFLFVQSVIVTVWYAGQATPPTVHAHHANPAISWPTYTWLIWIAAAVFLLLRFFWSRKPVDAALFWCLGAAEFALHFANASRLSTTYSTAAGAILAMSIIENSYLLAYHDELTALPSRRAFNDALLRLQDPYVIAAVDIDHFKRFNDTYGHDTGDEVLRLVASVLSRVSGGGQAYRCGGEEFSILFPGKSVSDVADDLERLRENVEHSEFRLRGVERRQAPRGPDRRKTGVRKSERKGVAIRRLAQAEPAPLSVTISIGAAESKESEVDPARVQQAADQALYRAKANGRNRVEASISKRRTGARTAGIA
jgi:GGDEF domain-containing protein